MADNDANEEKHISRSMRLLSTSIVSLHSCAELRHPETKPPKTVEKRPSIIYFLALFYAFLSMGLGTGLIGPSLLKFREQTDADLDRVVYILFARSFGFLAGTLIGGVLIDRFSSFGRTFLSFAILLACIATWVIPFFYHLIPMIIVHLVWSLAAGIISNLAQVLTMRYYKSFDVNPYLQALHGAFGAGALLSPLIIAPFLGKSSPVDQWHYAYWIIGLLHVPNLIWMLVYAVRNEFCAKRSEELGLENKEFAPAEKLTLRSILILGLITVFILLYVGDESAFGAYLHTYASLHLDFNKDTAAYLSSVYWSAFTFGHMCGIPLSIVLSPLQMIFSDLIGCIGTLTLLFIFNKSRLILWIGSILFGISVASIYPSAVAYTERHMPITGKRMSVLAVGGATGDAIIPLLIGYSFTSKWLGAIGLMAISLAVVILASLLFAFIVFYTKSQSKKVNHSDE